MTVADKSAQQADLFINDLATFGHCAGGMRLGVVP
ncbi:MAG: hypothetical protein RLY91_777 [Pseudomonadota bacterium]|jgi:hypothetical protein